MQYLQYPRTIVDDARVCRKPSTFEQGRSLQLMCNVFNVANHQNITGARHHRLLAVRLDAHLPRTGRSRSLRRTRSACPPIPTPAAFSTRRAKLKSLPNSASNPHHKARKRAAALGPPLFSCALLFVKPRRPQSSASGCIIKHLQARWLCRQLPCTGVHSKQEGKQSEPGQYMEKATCFQTLAIHRQ